MAAWPVNKPGAPIIKNNCGASYNLAGGLRSEK
jgi:hypothetical protein